MQNTARFSLNRTQLKYIALVAMLCDHSAYFLVSPRAHTLVFSLLRCVGRFTAPIMCYFLVEGFIYTRSRKNYAIRLGIFALISQIPWTLAENKRLFTLKFFTHQNMIFTLFLCFIILYVLENVNEQGVKQLLIVLLFAATYNSDWGLYAPTFVLIFYFYRNDRKKKFTFYFVIALLEMVSSWADALSIGYFWYECIWKIGIILVMPLLLSYNGKKGSSHPFHKWIFYLVYAGQFFVFYYLLTKGVRFA